MIKFLVQNTFLSGYYNILDEIKSNFLQDLNTQNIIVVPDKYTLNAEKMVFEYLKIDSTFNISVMSLTRLANLVLKNQLQNSVILSKQTGTMIVNDLLIKEKDNLKLFNKVVNKVGIAEIIYETICQLKSSLITPEDFAKNHQNSSANSADNLSLKVHDIALIYKDYESLLTSNMLDANNRLNLFNNQLQNSDIIKNSNVFFAFFDNFTHQQYETISKLIKFSKNFYISVCFNNFQNNKNIFVNSMLQNLLSNCREQNIEPKVEFYKSNLKDDFKFLEENLFSYSKPKPYNSNSINIYSANELVEEIQFIASQIKQKSLIDNCKPSDFTIAVNNLKDVASTIEQVFTENNIPYFLDYAKTLSQNFYIKHINNICNIVLNKFNKTDVFEYLKSPFCDITLENKNIFENYCVKYGINRDMFFNSFKDENIEEIRKEVINNLLEFNANIKSSKNVSEYINTINKFLEKNNSKNIFDIIVSSQILPISEQNACEQISDKLTDLFENMNKILINSSITFDMFFAIFNNATDATNLNTVPQGVNKVFIGEISECSFESTDYLFIVNANQSLPLSKADCGIITDSEIETLNTKYKISPQIKEINKTEKFKLFNICLLPKKELVISYSNLINGESEQPSSLITNLCSILNFNYQNKIQKLVVQNIADLPVYYTENNRILEKAFYYSTAKNIFKYAKSNNFDDISNNILTNFTENQKKSINYKADFNLFCTNNEAAYNKKTNSYENINEIFSDDKKSNNNSGKNYENINDNKGENINKKSKSKFEFFKDNHTKVSELECYFNCPFKHFMQYELKAKEREVCSIRPMDTGNILHAVAQYFVNELIENNFEHFDNFNKKIESIFNAVIAKLVDKSTNLINYELSLLKYEAIRMCSVIEKNLQNSSFKTLDKSKTEWKFAKYKLNDKYTINGIVDRIDELDNKFLIIDYKTGSNDEFDYKKVFYGLKIQIIIYMMACENILKKECAGVFYFPLTNAFDSDGETVNSKYKLSGIFLNDKNIIKALDNSLNIGDNTPNKNQSILVEKSVDSCTETVDEISKNASENNADNFDCKNCKNNEKLVDKNSANNQINDNKNCAQNSDILNSKNCENNSENNYQIFNNIETENANENLTNNSVLEGNNLNKKMGVSYTINTIISREQIQNKDLVTDEDIIAKNNALDLNEKSVNSCTEIVDVNCGGNAANNNNSILPGISVNICTGIVGGKIENTSKNDQKIDTRKLINETEKTALQNKSEIYKIKIKNDGEIDANTEKFALTTSEFENIKNYAKNVVNLAIKEIENGYIEPKPANDKICEYCPYSSVCGFIAKNEGARDTTQKILKGDFGGEKNE